MRTVVRILVSLNTRCGQRCEVRTMDKDEARTLVDSLTYDELLLLRELLLALRQTPSHGTDREQADLQAS